MIEIRECVCVFVVLNATCVWYLNSISACFLKWLLRPCEYMVRRVHRFGERSWERLAARLSCSGTGGARHPCALLWVWLHLLWLAAVCAGDTCPFQAEASIVRFSMMSSLCLALVFQVLLAQVTKCRNDPPPKSPCCQHTQTYVHTWALGADAQVGETCVKPLRFGHCAFFFSYF